jgi:hypothetical protein
MRVTDGRLNRPTVVPLPHQPHPRKQHQRCIIQNGAVLSKPTFAALELHYKEVGNTDDAGY